MATIVYTDGACSGNPGPGGWAWAVGGGRYASGAEAHSTNQRMEIAAAFDAVQSLEGTLEVVSDSTYVVNCFRDRWWEGWIKRGWLNSQKKPVANQDLWEPFIELVRARGDVSFRWVKGHSGDPMNDLVDRLAVEAATTQRGRSGIGEPEELGPPDQPGPPWAGGAGPDSARAALAGSAGPVGGQTEPSIAGHPLVVFGHRPPELGGYDDNPIARALTARLGEIIAAKATLAEDLAVVSGLRLGAEMLGAEAALAVGAPLIVVLPYPDPEKVWPKAAQERFWAVRDQAQDVIELQRRAPSSKQQAGAALARRDAWRISQACEAIVVWDGQDPALGKLVRSIEDRLADEVWVIDPGDLTGR